MTAITAKSILQAAAESKLVLTEGERLRFYHAVQTNMGDARATKGWVHLFFPADNTVVLFHGTDRELTIIDAPTAAYAQSAAAVALKLELV